jgi:hypothetical protein
MMGQPSAPYAKLLPSCLPFSDPLEALNVSARPLRRI